jgi:hypothetical protein
MDTEQFYCVGCQELKDAVFGHRVFRTGYFRLVYPLGCCLTCCGIEPARPAAAEASRPGAVFEPLDTVPQTPPAAVPSETGPSAVRHAAVWIEAAASAAASVRNEAPACRSDSRLRHPYAARI